MKRFLFIGVFLLVALLTTAANSAEHCVGGICYPVDDTGMPIPTTPVKPGALVPLTIIGPTQINNYTMARLALSGSASAILWDLGGAAADVQYSLDKQSLILSGSPGTYTISAVVAVSDAGTVTLQKLTHELVIGTPTPTPPPTPTPTPPPTPTPTPTPPPAPAVTLTLISAPTSMCPYCGQVEAESVPTLKTQLGASFTEVQYTDPLAQKVYGEDNRVPRWVINRNGTVEKKLGYLTLPQLQAWIKGQ